MASAAAGAGARPRRPTRRASSADARSTSIRSAVPPRSASSPPSRRCRPGTGTLRSRIPGQPARKVPDTGESPPDGGDQEPALPPLHQRQPPRPKWPDAISSGHRQGRVRARGIVEPSGRRTRRRGFPSWGKFFAVMVTGPNSPAAAYQRVNTQRTCPAAEHQQAAARVPSHSPRKPPETFDGEPPEERTASGSPLLVRAQAELGLGRRFPRPPTAPRPQPMVPRSRRARGILRRFSAASRERWRSTLHHALPSPPPASPLSDPPADDHRDPCSSGGTAEADSGSAHDHFMSRIEIRSRPGSSGAGPPPRCRRGADFRDG